MDKICRLCCSTKFVNNCIFDEESALYVKMSLYLPIKVFKNDQLPQKVCDKCSCKVNDFYQFCNETIEVQNRLKELLLSQGVPGVSVDLTVIKPDITSIPLSALCEQSTQTDKDDGKNNIKVKEEPKFQPDPETTIPIKDEFKYDNFDDYPPLDALSDNSDDEYLIDLKKKKKSKKDEVKNGVVKQTKRGRKRKNKPDELVNHAADVGMNLEEAEQETVFMKPQDFQDVLQKIQTKQEVEDDIYVCCMCNEQRQSRSDLLEHYKEHGRRSESASVKLAPPSPPPGDTFRCPRCQKVVGAGEWGKHWRRHYARDARPFRCARCDRSYRDPHQILKHGLTHKEEEGGGGAESSGEKRFACDLCPEAFVYMRCLLAHRTRAHPEAALRALALRCAVCARTFAHSNSLRRHLRAHSGERNFLCNVCGKALSSREHLKFHIRIHTGYKPNVCKVCGKGFVKKCNLTLHERVHSGEKPHVCAACGKAFSQRSTLVIHERYHSGARPYTCALCGRGFVAKGLLSMHLKTSCVDARPALSALSALSARS